MIKPPHGSAEINRAHPLSHGIVACWVMNEPGGQLIDLAGTVHLSLDEQWPYIYPTRVAVPRLGVSLHTDSASASGFRSLRATPEWSIGTGPFTWACLFRSTQTTEGAFISRCEGIGLTFIIQLRGDVGGRIYCWFLNSDASQGLSAVSTTTSWTTGLPTLAVITRDAAGVTTIYKDGGFDGEYGTASADLDTGITTTVHLSSRAAGTMPIVGDIGFMSFYRRCLSAKEIRALASDPYGFLKPRQARTPVVRLPGGEPPASRVPFFTRRRRW